MNRSLFTHTMRLLLATFMILTAAPMPCMAQKVTPVVGFPSSEPGYALGVSACYAGRIGQWIVMAGGCNFPSPGNKRYYDGIYAARADGDALHWKRVGTLPQAAAYGASVSSGDSIVFIGGSNAHGSLSTVFSVHLDPGGSKATLHRLAPLPVTTDNAAAALCGTDIFLVGGNQNGAPSAAVWRRSASATDGRWSAVAAMPGAPRVQPVAAACGGKVYVWGGFHAAADSSTVHTDGVCLDTATGKWHALASPRNADGEEMTLAGGAAWTSGRRILATGGVNKSIFLDAISGAYALTTPESYAHHPIGWYRFSPLLYEYDTRLGFWLPTVFSHPSLARAGAAVVPVPDMGCFCIGGEVKPTLRTPQIVMIKKDF